MDSPAIRNIIFDLGGVILNIDYRRLEAAFSKIGVRNFHNQTSLSIQNDVIEKFEKGLISPAVFRNELRRFIQTEISDSQLNETWNTILTDIPQKRIRLMEALKAKYRTFLLSNTNEIHYQKYNADLQQQYGYADLSDLFEKAYFSHKLRMRKPSLEIFRHVIVENNLEPAETLFVDDSLTNILGARQLGLVSVQLQADQDVTALFDPITFDYCPVH